MAFLRDRIEKWFAGLGRLIARRGWLFLFLSILAAGAMTASLPKIRMDTSAEGLLHKKDPALVKYKDFRRQFGQDQTILIGLNPADVFDLRFLQKLKEFHTALELEIPNIYEINSLANATLISGTGDDLVVSDLLDSLPQEEAGLAGLRQQIMDHPLYRGTILSEDATFTIISLTPVIFSTTRDGIPDDSGAERVLSEQEYNAMVAAVREVCKSFDSDDFPVILAGQITIEAVLKKMALDTMSRFTLLTTLFIILFTAVLFRRISGVVYPLLIVNLALYSTIGLMALMGVPMTLNTTVLPSFILAVGIGDSVHILAIFFRHFDRNHDKAEAISFALGHSGLAVVMTSLTTAGGLLSFMTAGIQPVAELGTFAAAGVMLALGFSLVTLPALLAALPVKMKNAPQNGTGESKLDTFLAAVGDFATGRPWPVITVSVILFAGALFLALQLKFFHNSLHYLPKDNEIRVANEIIDKKMNGSLNVEILVDTNQENGLYNPEVMRGIEKAQLLGETLRIAGAPAGKSISVVDTIKDMNQALHGGDPEFFILPEEQDLIAQELLLYEIGGGKDLRALVDSDNRKARITLNLPWVDAIEYTAVLLDYEHRLQKIFGTIAKAEITGIVAIICRTFDAIIRTMATSYLIAGTCITVLMILLLGNLRLGLISMIPNFLPIVMGLGFMKIVGIPLDYSTIMVGGIAIGLAVDDTVHFMHNFRRYYDRTGDARQAVHQTLTTTGRAMLFTTLILSAGFFILIFADLKSTANFGLITGFTIVMALLADFLLAPALMVLLARKCGLSPARQVVVEPGH